MLFGDYQHDVFISYVRGAGPINFHKVREVIARKLGLLARDTGSPKDLVPSVCLDDTDLPSNGSLSDEIRRAAASSAFLICFVSDGYFSSDYCAQEVDAFLDAQARRGRSPRDGIWLLEHESGVRLPASVALRLEGVKWEKLHDARGPIHDTLDDGGSATRNPRFDRIIEDICDTLWERAERDKLLSPGKSNAMVKPPPGAGALPRPRGAGHQRVVIGVGDRGAPELAAAREALLAELRRIPKIDAASLEDRLFEESDDPVQPLKQGLAEVSLLVLVTSGRETSLTDLKLQRGALNPGVPCLLLRVGDTPPRLMPRQDDPEPLSGGDIVAAASRICVLLGASPAGEETRPYIIAATNDRAEECYLARLAERINQIWMRKRSASPPGIIASTYGDLDKLAQLGGDYHGFVAILASMMGRSVPKYMDEVVKFAKSNKLDKQTAVAVFPPLPQLVFSPVEIINCNPDIDEADLAEHLDQVWERWQAQCGAAQ